MSYLLIDWIFPLLAIAIYFATPKGCYRDINTILACLIVFIFGYEEYIIASGIYDSELHDIIMISLYSLAACLFHLVGGRIQLLLACIGVVLHIGYFGAWAFIDYPHDYYYRGAFVTLTVLQLLAASKGALWSILYKKVQGVINGRANRGSDNASGGSSLHRNSP